MAELAICDGVLSPNANGTIDCTGTWMTATYVPPFDISQIDPAVATAFVTAGFVIMVIPWGTAYGISRLTKAISNFAR
jgi:hypothetical protein